MGKKIFLLIGPKGSGKSYLGTLIEKTYGILFVRVEDWAKLIKKERSIDNETYLSEVFYTIETGIRESIVHHDQIVFESTGLSGYFDRMLENLSRDFEVVTIGVRVNDALCLQRVKSRDQSIHINVSDQQVNDINHKVAEKAMSTDFIITNEEKEEEELLVELQAIMDSLD